jgi:hypothetical protein
MAVIEVGMTLDDALASVKPIPAKRYKGILVGWDKDDKGQIKQRTKDGKKVKFVPLFKVVDPDQNINGRQLRYQAIVGSFSYGELGSALPQIFVGTGIDDQLGLGSEVWLDVSVSTYEGRERNQVDHIYHINAQ